MADERESSKESVKVILLVLHILSVFIQLSMLFFIGHSMINDYKTEYQLSISKLVVILLIVSLFFELFSVYFVIKEKKFRILACAIFQLTMAIINLVLNGVYGALGLIRPVLMFRLFKLIDELEHTDIQLTDIQMEQVHDKEKKDLPISAPNTKQPASSNPIEQVQKEKIINNSDIALTMPVIAPKPTCNDQVEMDKIIDKNNSDKKLTIPIIASAPTCPIDQA